MGATNLAEKKTGQAPLALGSSPGSSAPAGPRSGPSGVRTWTFPGGGQHLPV